MTTLKFLLAMMLLVPSHTFVTAQIKLSTSGNPLADTKWMLTSFGVGGVGNPLIERSAITLKFGSESRASGSGGCNTFGADYNVNGNKISFGRVISTRRACVDQRLNQQEQRYLGALESAETFRLDGNSLVIFHDDGRNRLLFMSTATSGASDPRFEDLTSPVNLLTSFYNAIDARDYERAYRYWETPPASLEVFERGYRDTTNVRVFLQPPTRIEGAAGSMYAEVPTLVIAHQQTGRDRARQQDGRDLIFVGCYVTRKSSRGLTENSVESSWRIYRVKLFPVSSITSIPQLLVDACKKM
jgi:heat shock protein HslJ